MTATAKTHSPRQPHDRDAALDRALEVFWRRGFHATSMKDLEAALGMHPGSIYAAFQSKEALFRLALARYGAARAAERDATVAAAPGPLAGLARYIREVNPVVRDDLPVQACLLAKTALETGLPDGETRAALEDLLRQTEDGFAAIFEAARAAGDLPADADPRRLAQKLHVNLMGLGVYAQRPDRIAETRAMAEDLARGVEALARDR